MTAPTTGGSAILAALLAVVEAEQTAAFGYGALGPRLNDPGQISRARNCEQAHRDLTATALTMTAALSAGSSGPTSPSSPDAYQLPGSARDLASARALAVALEQQCASAWRYVLARIAATTGPGTDSSWPIAVAALRDSAVRAVGWRRLTDPASASVAFPGI